MAASISKDGRFRAVFLSVIMVLMTQVGYTDNMDFSIGLNQDTESKDTGGSTPALSPSVEGADLIIDEAMTNITFQYNASAASGSGSNGSGSSSSTSAFAYANDKFSAGAEHNCAILANGDLKCWGWDGYGQLGDGATTEDKTSPQSTPVNLGSGRTAVAVAAGGTTSCAILDNGELKCWGRDNYGQIGNGGSSHYHTTQATSPGNPINLGTNRTAVAVSAGGSHTCAILDNGDLKCWGRDWSGQLGDGGPAWTSNNPTDTYAPSSTAINFGSGRTAVAVSAGGAHTCAILDNGDLKCWGSDQYGQLGDGGTNHNGFGRTDTNSPPSTAIDLGAGRTAVAVSAYWSNTCAILDNGEVKCWGRNHEGQLGDGSNTDSTTPSSTAINLGAGRTAVALSGGYYHTCAILDNGDLKCWGNDGSGQLGDGGGVGDTNAPSSTAIDLGTGRTAVAVAPGNQHTCALLDNGSAKCWGVDNSGQLGTAGSNQGVQYSPVFVSGNDSWNSSTGASSGSGGGMTNVTGATSCTVSPALPTGLSIDGSTCTISGTPTAVASNTTYTIVATLNNVNYQGTFWLSSAYYELTPSVEGANLLVGEAMEDITFQYNASAASGSGSGSGSGSSGSSAFAYANNKLSIGSEHTCAILDNGDLKCWGTDVYGQLGDGNYNNNYGEKSPPSTPVNLGSGRTAVAVSAGGYSTCAILDNGELKCWGTDVYGQVGNGGSSSSHNSNSRLYSPSGPINLGTNRTAVAVSAGGSHTCAILDNGDLKCWGRDLYGQLGDGGPAHTSNNPTDTYAPSSTAIDLGSGRTAVAVSAGGAHTCAILDNGDLKCWGSDSYGQLGDGGTNHSGYGRTDTNSPPSTAIDLGAGRTAVAVSAYGSNTCAILDNGEVKCWGRNREGQLGDGSNTDSTTPSSTAINLGAGRTAVALSGGYDHTCAILDNGDLKCWGQDGEGQLGDGGSGGSTNAPSSTAIDLGTGRTAVAVGAGSHHTCALLDNGSAKCWGRATSGALGIGSGYTQSRYYSPVFVSGNNSWNSSTGASSGSGSGSGGGMTNVTGATCSVSPALPTGLSINSSTCTISGTPTVETSNTTYTVTANISGTTYQGTVWLATVPFGTITSPVMGAELDLGEAMTPITLNYTSLASPQAPAVSWEIHPELPEGMTLVNGVISGTPTVYAVNQTYTIYANQSGQTTTFDMYFSVDTNNPHTVVENQPIDPIGFHGPFQNGTTNWTVSPALPADLVMDPNTGEITGSVNGVLANTTYTVTATHGSSGSGGSTGTGATETFTFSLESLGDLDGDGLPNELPSDYDAAEGPTPGLVADTDDDADGLEDVVETGTSIYVDNNDTGSNPLDPDTDDDGICDGPNAVPPICVAGPDSAPNGDGGPPIWIGLFNTEGASLGPYKSLPGGTYEIMPDLPQSLTMDPNTGVISGTPTQTLENTTFTVWVNRSDGASLSWNFSIEILADSDGDGLPDELPDDYDPSNPTAPGLVEDLDDDNDGIPDSEEGDGLDSTNPDTDGDGYCDGQISVDPICVAGPDAFPLDPSAHTDTDGDGKPDTITGNSTLVPPLEEDMDDDGDGVEDVNETGTWTYNGPTDTGTNPLNPDTDYDGVCDGPVDVYHPQTGDLICVAGPDTDLGNLAVGTHYAVNGSAIETIRPEWVPTGAVWEVSPDLPADLTINPDNGIISGIPKEVTENITYTIYGNGTFSDYTSTFNLQVLEDTDRDGLPNALPDDYDNSTVTPMVEDLDDDGDGLSDLAETGTGVYNGTSDYGTDPLNPDTDGDGVCDGPNSVWPICINGPDSNPFGTHDGVNIVLVENIAIETPIPPPNQVPGAVWEISPALPAGLNLDISSGIITGTATEVSDNTTYTLWANVSDFGRSDSVALSVMATFGLTVLEDSDGDGMPNELPDDYDPTVGILVKDLDDDNDGLLDTEEDELGSDPTNPDSDGDGFCDGPTDVYADDGTLVCRGPDPEPLDSTLPVDTDGDMFPDEDPDGEGGLEADTDDDGDGFSDELENNCGSDPLDANDNPSDMDGDTICDLLDPDIDGDGLNNTVETNTGIFISDADSGTDPYNPDTDGDGYCDGPVSPNYSNCTAGPDAFPTDASAHLDTDGDGNPDTITGNSTTGLIEDLDDDGDGIFDSVEAGCGTDPLDASETPELDSEGNCVEKQASAESLFEWSWSWCFCLIFLLLLLLLIPIVMQRDRILVMMGTGPEPENTVSEPEFMEGAGTIEDPFILEPSKKIKAGESISSKEVITIDSMTVRNVEMIDLNQEDNGDKFSMYETGFDEIGVRLISVGDDGEITINMHFDDSVGGATYAGGEFTGLLKLGSASVYLSWTVNVKPDKKKLKEIEKAEKEAKKAEEEAAAKEAEEKAAREAEEAEARKKAEEEAAALLAEEEAAAAALLAKEEEEKAAKEAEEKAAKEAEEAEAKKKAEEEAAALLAEEEAAAAALLAKEEEEKAAKEAEEKAAKEAEEAEAKKKAEEEAAAAALIAKEEEEKAAKKKAEAEAKKKAKKPASPKEAKKQEELQRVKERAKTIDFKVIGKASSSELKSEVKKGAKTLEVADASEFADSGSAQITDEDGSSVIAWTGKDGNTLTGVTGVKRVYGAASIVVVKDDLQVIKGVGPFIEEKLNALGITTYRQIANMNAKLEKQVNEAIEFFPGRVKRDQWVAQAKILLGEDVKLDEKALKQAEELERVAKKAEKIDFKTIGVASASDRDNLQELKGIGPFIEEKLNALGIFKFEQIAKMTSKIEDEVNIAIEFFPGRVKRDQWVAQAKIKIGEDVKLDEKALKKAEELERVAKKAEKIDFGTIGVASASDKDNLQELKGIGPFIEEKLNALGIFKFEQIAKMTSKIEDEVNIAIEFFPGRVKRDEWVKQAKERTK